MWYECKKSVFKIFTINFHLVLQYFNPSISVVILISIYKLISCHFNTNIDVSINSIRFQFLFVFQFMCQSININLDSYLLSI